MGMDNTTSTNGTEIANLPAGTHYLLPSDCRGDGFDIACQPREDASDAIRKMAPAGSVVGAIRANGFICGYTVVVPEQDEVIALVQHSGSYGPWYHQSVYRRDPATKSGYRFIANLGGHYSSRSKPALPVGRPNRANTQYAY